MHNRYLGVHYSKMQFLPNFLLIHTSTKFFYLLSLTSVSPLPLSLSVLSPSFLPLPLPFPFQIILAAGTEESSTFPRIEGLIRRMFSTAATAAMLLQRSLSDDWCRFRVGHCTWEPPAPSLFGRRVEGIAGALLPCHEDRHNGGRRGVARQRRHHYLGGG